MKNIFHLPKSPKPWNTRRKPQHGFLFFFLSVTLLAILILFIAYCHIPKSLLLFSSKNLNSSFLQCQNAKALIPDQKFLFYAPHSGFSNQLQEFKNAILMAGILNRTLIVPPILDHHAVALGSCPKFRVLSPNEIRISVWDHVIELLRSGRYVSIADIIDISPLVSSSLIQVTDFRVFAALWCGVEINLACSNDLNTQRALFDRLNQCGSTLSGFKGNVDECLYAVDEDCRTTVWIYQNGDGDGMLDLFQPDEQLKKKKKISFARRRRDVYKALGPGSEADSAVVLAFGSLFTAPYKGSELYIDVNGAPKDEKIQSLIKKIEFIPFVPEILSTGKRYAVETIRAPFLCTQLRLLDGQFKSHWKTTFWGLKQKLNSLRQLGPRPLHIFVMTDLPEETAQKLATARHGLRYGSIPRTLDRVTRMKKLCPERFSDVRLYIEESVCSCASLGFVGTAGSTIAESIELIRKFDVCSSDIVIAS